MNKEQKEKRYNLIKKEREDGKTLRELGVLFNISKDTIAKILKYRKEKKEVIK